jgi:hypothetical protein
MAVTFEESMNALAAKFTADGSIGYADAVNNAKKAAMLPEVQAVATVAARDATAHLTAKDRKFYSPMLKDVFVGLFAAMLGAVPE